MSGITPIIVTSPTPHPEAANEEADQLKTPYIPPEPRTVFLGGIFTIMLLAALSMAADIIVPVVLAFIIKMVLYPIMRAFETIHVPRIMAALLVILMLLGGAVAVGVAVATPAAEWTRDLPKELPRLKERLHDLRSPIEPIQKVLNDAQNLAASTAGGTAVVAVQQQPNFPDRFMANAQYAVFGLLETLVILFFLLVSGDTFLRRLVEILPRFRDKKQAINISNQIESDISAYLLTITIMNAVVGSVTAAIMYFTGIGDPVLWGVVAFLMNYVPIVGPIVTAGLFVLIGMVSENDLMQAVMPAGLYLLTHVTESQFVTPMLLARHFTLNPVLVILGLVFFYWMWGIPGAILSMPILAMIKVMCDNIDSLKPFGHFIEG